MDFSISRINRPTVCSKSCTHTFSCPSLPWNHWACREDLYIWVWMMWSTGEKRKWAFLLCVEFSRQAHACRNRLKDVLCHRNFHTHSTTGALTAWEWLRESSSGELNVYANKATGWAGLFNALCALEHAFTACRSVSLKSAKLLDWHSYRAGWIVTSWKIPFKCQTRTWIISKHLQQAQHNSFWNLADTYNGTDTFSKAKSTSSWAEQNNPGHWINCSKISMGKLCACCWVNRGGGDCWGRWAWGSW